MRYFGLMGVDMSKEDVLDQNELFLNVECLHFSQQLLSLCIISTLYHILDLSKHLHCFFIGLTDLTESIDGLEEDSKHFVGDLSRKAIDELAFVCQKDCWDGFDLETIGNLAEFIDIDVEKLDSPVALFCLLFEPGSHGLACEVPICIKIDKNGQLSGAGDGVEFLQRFELDDI